MKIKFFWFLFFTFLLNNCSKINNNNNFKIIQNKQKHELISKHNFSNGNISELEYKCDSIDIKNNIKYKTLFFSFFENGNLKEKGYQGNFRENNVPVGTWEQFNLNGELILKTTFHNDDFGIDYILKQYYKNGKVIKIVKTNNYILYETEMKTLK